MEFDFGVGPTCIYFLSVVGGLGVPETVPEAQSPPVVVSIHILRNDFRVGGQGHDYLD